MSLSARVRARAHELGFEQVGIARADVPLEVDPGVEHDTVVILELAFEIAVLLIAEVEEEGATRVIDLVLGAFQVGDLVRTWRRGDNSAGASAGRRRTLRDRR